MHRPISGLYTKPLCPVESLHLFCRLLIFHFSGGNMPLLGWPRWYILCKYLIAVLGDPGSPPGKLQEITSVPNPPELWAVPPLWLNPDHKVEDGSCVLFWDLPPTLPCDLSVWHSTGQRHCALSHGMFSIHGWQPEMYLCALNCFTMVEDVIRCPEMFPLPPLPTCQNKYLIWKLRYRSQLDWTRGLVSFLLLLLLFF